MPKRRISRLVHKPTLAAADRIFALRPAGKYPETLIAVHRWTRIIGGRNVVAHIYVAAGEPVNVVTQVFTPSLAEGRIADMAAAFDIHGWRLKPVVAGIVFEQMTGGGPAPCPSCCKPLPFGAIYCTACTLPIPRRRLAAASTPS